MKLPCLSEKVPTHCFYNNKALAYINTLNWYHISILCFSIIEKTSFWVCWDRTTKSNTDALFCRSCFIGMQSNALKSTDASRRNWSVQIGIVCENICLCNDHIALYIVCKCNENPFFIYRRSIINGSFNYLLTRDSSLPDHVSQCFDVGYNRQKSFCEIGHDPDNKPQMGPMLAPWTLLWGEVWFSSI